MDEIQLPLMDEEGAPSSGGAPACLADVLARLDGRAPQPLVVAYGLGADSTAILIELGRRYQESGWPVFRPEAVLFADTGAEKPETYAYLPVMNAYLERVGFPPVTVVRYPAPKSAYKTLEGQCLHTGTLPSLAYGGKSCSLKWKKAPQDQWMNKHSREAALAWAYGLKVIKVIGYDAGKADGKRAGRQIGEEPKYWYWYPLIEWGWDRERCLAEIAREGLPGWNRDNEGPDRPLTWVQAGGVPIKSACFFCPASKTWEIDRIARDHPELAARIIQIETGAAPKLRGVEGLWRSSTKKRPGSMTTYLNEKGGSG